MFCWCDSSSVINSFCRNHPVILSLVFSIQIFFADLNSSYFINLTSKFKFNRNKTPRNLPNIFQWTAQTAFILLIIRDSDTETAWGNIAQWPRHSIKRSPILPQHSESIRNHKICPWDCAEWTNFVFALSPSPSHAFACLHCMTSSAYRCLSWAL